MLRQIECKKFGRQRSPEVCIRSNYFPWSGALQPTEICEHTWYRNNNILGGQRVYALQANILLIQRCPGSVAKYFATFPWCPKRSSDHDFDAACKVNTRTREYECEWDLHAKIERAQVRTIMAHSQALRNMIRTSAGQAYASQPPLNEFADALRTIFILTEIQ